MEVKMAGCHVVRVDSIEREDVVGAVSVSVNGVSVVVDGVVAGQTGGCSEHMREARMSFEAV